jgi:hypothetical protein
MIGYWLVLVATIHTISHFLSCPWTWATSTLLISFPRQPLRVNSPNHYHQNGVWWWHWGLGEALARLYPGACIGADNRFWSALTMIPVLIIDWAWILKFESQEYPDYYLQETVE